MNSIRNLLIDLDGTLISFNELQAKIYFIVKAMTWNEFRVSPLKLLYSLSLFKSNIINNSDKNLIYNKAIKTFSQTMNISINDSEKILINFIEYIFPLLRKYFSIIPEANSFINWAKNRYKLYLATNPFWPPEFVNLRLQWAGIDVNTFKFISHSKNMYYSKHSKLYFQDFLSQNNLKSEECLMIGNKLALDGNARKIGMNVFILNLQNKKNNSHKEKNLENSNFGTVNFGNYYDLKNYLERNSLCL
nr:HAD family hydrolase [Pigmentibacter ruber]